MSVAKSWTLGGLSRRFACSQSSIATEYASSPVAQPATQTRTSSSFFLPAKSCGMCASRAANRSEEHTSELQSRFDLVCRLLLEKKKQRLKEISWSPQN